MPETSRGGAEYDREFVGEYFFQIRLTGEFVLSGYTRDEPKRAPDVISGYGNTHGEALEDVLHAWGRVGDHAPEDWTGMREAPYVGDITAAAVSKVTDAAQAAQPVQVAGGKKSGKKKGKRRRLS